MTPDTLLRDPEASEAASAAPTEGAADDQTPPEATVEVERPCPSCGAALEPEQDWCLECGSAAAGRSGGLPGWRTAAATLAICLTLASGAVAAAYAAMNAEDTPPPRTTAQVNLQPVDDGPDLGAAPAIGADPAPVTPPADPGAAPAPVDPPAPAPPVSSAPPPPVPTPAPVTPVIPSTPSTPSGGSSADQGAGGSDGGGGSKGDGTGDEAPQPPVEQAPLTLVGLGGATATVFDPSGRPADAFTDPALAFDGDPSTAWTVELSPEDVARPEVGLALDLVEQIGARRLVVRPTTPGTTVEVYGSDRAQAPSSLRAWTSLATRLDVQGRTRIPLGDGEERFRHLLIVFADGPVGGETSVGIAELELFE